MRFINLFKSGGSDVSALRILAPQFFPGKDMFESNYAIQ